MLSDLGRNRVLTLSVLSLLGAALAIYLYFYVQPEIARIDRASRIMKESINKKQQDLEGVRVESEVLIGQGVAFEGLKKQGFFEDQNRSNAKKSLTSIAKIANVRAKARINPGRFVEDEYAARSNRYIMETQMDIAVDAISDVDIYKFIFLLENYFPGHLTVNKVSFNREQNVTGPVLRAIASGREPTLAKAEIRFIWRTMVKADKAKVQIEQQKR